MLPIKSTSSFAKMSGNASQKLDIIKTMARLTLLGTGTSDGIPMLNCACCVCTSTDKRNKRLRASALVQNRDTNLLIDCGPDFRQQALLHQINHLSAIILTHHHADHIGGIPELRPLSRKEPVDLYASPYTSAVIRSNFSYIFSGKPTGGGLPRLNLLNISTPLTIAGLTIWPLPVLHGEDLIHGYRIGELAYITDASYIPEETFGLLEGIKYLVLNALRDKPHATHFSIQEACSVAARTTARQTWLTHLCHMVDHTTTSASLPAGVALAEDGLEIEFDETTFPPTCDQNG